jgi:hypothetical protein
MAAELLLTLGAICLYHSLNPHSAHSIAFPIQTEGSLVDSPLRALTEHCHDLRIW